MHPRPLPLPAVVALAPHRTVLPLGSGERLIGLDPETALVVADLPHALAEMLDELCVPAEPEQLVARAVARGADAAAARTLLHELVSAGTLLDSADVGRSAVRRRTTTVTVHGRGPLTVGIVSGLALAGVAVSVETGGTVRAGDLGTGFQESDCGVDRLAAIRGVVRRLSPTARIEPAPQRRCADLVVLADEVPLAMQVAELHAERVPHLLARVRDGVGVVGPLVLPGRSACLACLDLHRAARDPSWPRVAALLAGRQGTAGPACLAATVALTTEQALAAIGGMAGGAAAPPTLEATLELDLAAGTLRRRSWTALLGCTCGAATIRSGMQHLPATSATSLGGTQ